MEAVVAAYLLIFSIGDEGGIRYQAFEMPSMEVCIKSVETGKLDMPDGGDAQAGGGMVCLTSLDGFKGFGEDAWKRKINNE